ncbi:hypothetical protein IMCC21224_113376 [Puniceibacterium sp. IMCC21224]|nr:hypothetical protein IMCC21224_113376 [Puniceibacterium sp. IMCC21224]
MLKRQEFDFRQAQATFDLIWMLQSLEDARLVRAGGEAFPAVVRNQSCRFESDFDSTCFGTLVSKAVDAGEDANIAVAMIVANDRCQ